SSRAKPDHIAWAVDNEKGKEHVAFQTFVRKFGYTDRSSAVSSYTLLLEASQIERQRSKRLVEDFTEFQDNSSALFWSEAGSGKITRAAGLKQADDDIMCLVTYPERTRPDVDWTQIRFSSQVWWRPPVVRKLIRVILAIPQRYRC
ncbi:hypothetical protein BG011_002509, partial [Mortierella polycephala]